MSVRDARERWASIARAEPLGRVLVYVALVTWVLLVALGWARGTLPLRPLLAAIGITLVLAIGTPSNQSGDVNSYAMYGRIITVHHQNPFASYPMHFEGDPMRRRVGQIWQRTPDIYGLGFTVIMAVLAPLIGTSSFLVH